ncbi:hypothetical protein NX02_14455 [Sphingomonas sanxanigenens DSM 19645 = NX02]|uniref:DUF454 domain-containing protein n=2 Tax=Sphingomonas sanxanigenens TaxID=397260 RepID=W0ABX5_9SPHN|nr:hypothetical protein NX02_14455 [Sphingomonas sanxanigenens DSM 19645 = NX02]
MRQRLWAALGLAFVVVGIVGIILPVMPGTVFLIIAAACFTRSSPRLEAWLLDHPRYGPPVRSWREEGAIPRRGKIAAVAGMIVGYASFLWGTQPSWPLGIGVLAVFVGCMAYVVSRPVPRAQ